jgi:hypothetical protein
MADDSELTSAEPVGIRPESAATEHGTIAQSESPPPSSDTNGQGTNPTATDSRSAEQSAQQMGGRPATVLGALLLLALLAGLLVS